MAKRPSREEALDYHARHPPGKIGVVPTKPSRSQADLSLAYTPGVAEPCRQIEANPDDVFEYTNRANTVAVVTNGSAVLGLGDIGPAASKPVMEGKSVLFKQFGDVNAVDLEVDTDDPEEFIATVENIEPTYGGINLEDITAPECFQIEEALAESLDIPVFHDDQHGTAIIGGAALLNALELADKRIQDVDVVFSGAGAAAIACADFFQALGAREENIVMCDSSGVIHTDREDVNEYKAQYARETDDRDLADAMQEADVFIGVSVGGIVSQDMVASMAEDPIVMAMANPDPEIAWEEAHEVREDLIMATGRSDYPNQVNNVLGFPFIFRGALDVRATTINTEMKIAAAEALADLAREDVPDHVASAYGEERLSFGRDYLIPKPLDRRVLLWVAPAVARAAIETGVTRREIDIEGYVEELERRQGKAREMMRIVLNKAKRDPKRVVFAEGEDPTIIRAAARLQEEGYAQPVLLGERERIEEILDELELDAKLDIVDPVKDERADPYAEHLYEQRQRKGVTRNEAHRMIGDPNYFGSVMVDRGDADVFMSGRTTHYPDALRPALRVIGTRPDTDKVSGVYMMTFEDEAYFFADTTVNIDPSSEDLAEISLQAAEVARRFNVDPRVALLSFSDFGSTTHPLTRRVHRAAELVKERAPDLEVDGEMQADTALVEDILQETYHFSDLAGSANTLIFPNLESGNIGYKLLQRLADAEATGPILVGTDRPVMILQRGDSMEDVVDLAAIAVVDAQNDGDGF
ncbi:NADP-dependent malic enzyme [Thermoplasmatales archaeon SW_10_69_26]|nr:MAG: NADP-dependent malic enzyme [Thermoplasmatales archaeon SW_10_69_26]